MKDLEQWEHSGHLGLPEPGQGGKEEKSRAELSGQTWVEIFQTWKYFIKIFQTGGRPPGWQDGREPSLQILGLLNSLPSPHFRPPPSAQRGGPCPLQHQSATPPSLVWATDWWCGARLGYRVWYAVVVSQEKDWYDITGVQALCDVEWWLWLSLEQGGKEEEETSWPSLQTGRLPSSHRGLVPSLHSLGRFPPAKGRNLWPLPASRKAERRNREVFMPSQSALNWHWCWVLSIECTLQSTIFSLPSRESTP